MTSFLYQLSQGYYCDEKQLEARFLSLVCVCMCVCVCVGVGVRVCGGGGAGGGGCGGGGGGGAGVGGRACVRLSGASRVCRSVRGVGVCGVRGVVCVWVWLCARGSESGCVCVW